MNIALAMCGVRALNSTPIRRLELTWRNVDSKRIQFFNQIKKRLLCENSDSNSDNENNHLYNTGPESTDKKNAHTSNRVSDENVNQWLPTELDKGAIVPYLPRVIDRLTSYTLHYIQRKAGIYQLEHALSHVLMHVDTHVVDHR